MSWSSHALRYATVGLMLVLTGCGFRPLYGDSGSGAVKNLTGTIKVQPIADRSGQMLRNHLLNRLGSESASGPMRYSLAVSLTESIRELAIRLDEVATRANMTLTAHYQLTQIVDGKSLDGGTVLSTVSYNILQNDFATISAQNNARERGLRDLSGEIELRVALYMKRVQETSKAASR